MPNKIFQDMLILPMIKMYIFLVDT